jgi:predicted TIM-barrel fold metal-dependent hydrolase
MEIRHGAISADSHAAFHRHDFTSRMSAAKWGDRIPQVVEVELEGRRLDRWDVYAKPARAEGSGATCNCPALMGEPFPSFPTRWEEVPPAAYDPRARLAALDTDRVDAEVLFPPFGPFFELRDPDFELDVVQASNDTLGEWTQVSDRYLPLAIIPYLQEPRAIGQEIERAIEGGNRGVHVLGQTPKSLPHITDPYWHPIWDVCQELGVPVNFHGFSGLSLGIEKGKRWSGYTPRQWHSASVSPSAVTPGQIIPQLIFSGLAERFPRLNFVFAETGIGGFYYALGACDHEWETRQLWKEGLTTRPSEIIRRQMFANFWFEAGGVELRQEVGVGNLMWESDFPHVASFYPRSRDVAARILDGVSDDDCRQMLYANALRLYRIQPSAVVQGVD